MQSDVGFRSSSSCKKFRVERLECRVQPSAGFYTPPTNFQINPAHAAIASRIGQQPLDIALTYLNDHAADFGATPADLVAPFVTSQYKDANSGTTHLYLRQNVNGLQVRDADLSVAVLANGNVFSVGGGFIANLEANIDARPAGQLMDSLSAVTFAATNLDLTLSDAPELMTDVFGPVRSFDISAPSISLDSISAQLHFVPTSDGSAVLAWQLIIRTPDGGHWYDVGIDAMSGATVALGDWIEDAGYNVIPQPNEHPNDGGSTILTNPANATVSPFGWHDTNGIAGAEFTTTVGNNVDAHLDRDANNVADSSPPRPNGGAILDFTSFEFNPTLEPSALQNQNAAVVNLFYVNNLIHDIYYQYGFTEVAGNFQTNNYGKGGSGNDAVQADAQDGSGLDNANFGTPPDGSAPRMQMYEWTSTSPRRDSDFDNGIIIHEYTHGLTNRLTGGPANSNALNNTQSGGMGEGWSDYYALMLGQRPTDIQNGSHGIGTYVTGQAPTGTGIRRFPYSYNMAINPLTWDAYGTSGTTSYGVTRTTQVHRTGEIWASALWDMNWLLINKYGYDPNLSTGWTAAAGPGHAGNKLAMRLVMHALTLQPANPTFIQARDAIIAADIALNGGADLFEIWSAFARRGLGQGASTPDSNSTATPILSFTLPMVVSSVVPATSKVVTTHPASYVVNVTSAIDAATLDGTELLVNGIPSTGFSYTPGATLVTFTFAIDPVLTEGPQSVLLNANAFTRASDSSPVAKFTSDFYYDATPLTVTSISPSAGSTVALPFTTIDVNLDAAVDPSSVQNSDLSLTQGTVAGFALMNSDKTVRFTVGNLLHETKFNVFVAAGAFADLEGNPNAVFTGGVLTLDYTTFPFTAPLTARNVPGSLVYDGTFAANVGFVGDSDSFTISLDAGQSLNVVVTPNGALRPSLSVTGPGTNLTFNAATNGATAQLEQISIASGGLYTFKVSGLVSTVGSYSIFAELNQTDEAESNGGGFNDTLATAQNIDASFVNLGSGSTRAAILGHSDQAATNESEPNSTTATATTVTSASSLPTNLYQLGISGANSSTSDSDYFTIGTMQVGDVITFTNSGVFSGRGTQTDALARIYRNNGGSPIEVINDDDSGTRADGGALPGDALIYRYTVTTADTYIIRASRATQDDIGSYQLSVLLENTGAAPSTGGTLITEVEPNNTSTTPNNASTSWRQVKYDIGTAGTITAGDTDLYSYQFTAGDVVSIIADSTSTLAPRTALLDAAGVALAAENGNSIVAGAGGFSPIYGYRIPTTGTYYVRVQSISGTTGSYTANVYRSTTDTMPALPPAKDVYSLTLTTGQSVSVAIKDLTAGAVNISVLDGAGAVVATGLVGPSNVNEIIANYTAPTSGTYYIQGTGPANIDYQLIVLKSATFDTEANDSFGAAQTLGGGNAVLGHISVANEDWYQLNLTAGNQVTVSTTTPGGNTGEFVNNLDPTIELYDPSNVLVGTDDNSNVDGRNATLTATAAATGAYRVRMRGVASTAGEYVLRANVVTTPAPTVAGVVIGDGTNQRSTVSTIKVDFDQVVTLPVNVADAFTLTRQGGGTVTLSGVAVNSPNTSVTLTFTGGSVDFDSLADGRYDLTILSSLVTGAGGNLDGDDNGVGGDNYALIGTPANGLFRIFGDADGDGSVATNDFIEFRLALGGPNFVFDFDNDTAVAASDFIQFRLRFGGSI